MFLRDKPINKQTEITAQIDKISKNQNFQFPFFSQIPYLYRHNLVTVLLYVQIKGLFNILKLFCFVHRLYGSKRCARCNTPISASELVMRARDLVFHVHCFSCALCSARLTKGDTFGIRDSAVYCRLVHSNDHSFLHFFGSYIRKNNQFCSRIVRFRIFRFRSKQKKNHQFIIYNI